VPRRLGVPFAAIALATASAFAAQNAPTAKPSQPAAPPGRVDVGGVLYKKVGCYQCHANEAQGGLSGPRIGPNLVPFARFSEYIRKPTGEMPPYTPKVLTDQDIADIYAWVQARPRPPAVNTIPQLAP
jgi:mono/diheme cytochrome c family protein